VINLSAIQTQQFVTQSVMTDRPKNISSSSWRPVVNYSNQFPSRYNQKKKNDKEKRKRKVKSGLLSLQKVLNEHKF